ncbi:MULTISPECIES: serine/threonine protein kinase [unclassified Undibacterium]|uniref:serine/threonine protein kinase n=1 Tax=unclassified Undibacterium TaxID=2630295 RepID=UPI002AC9089E|nr:MULTISPECIES: serine/threonine protein kinase [unclassified Undibacterium]MEB0140147.1 serine/threonine protein kinase [Undibacterium sp. CCC2.1]MEB0173585.1 serine/threonine protein kinase [Undibacterium sp. CCC1.1]MEB0177559.1 serine/threonine protein kinase [Undibacterium sp. CCC3.4]MEB0214438.1 serine/threonine protein kinase [Undibacterium sp. 5I2]WPX42835.1 serine/threonine protein kinase [Undibacterium sp. CCC3.4]
MTEHILPTSFAELSPLLVLDAVDSCGYRTDGRILALNSYENRVYQVELDDAAPVIAKFYRPQRWSDAAIMEEHQFVEELLAQEIPVVPALCGSDGASLRTYQGYRFALFARQSGRAPEISDAATLEWLGRFIGRIHAVGAVRPYAERPALDLQSFGVAPREWLLAHDFVPPALLPAYRSVSQQVLDGVARCYERAGAITLLRLHGDCHMGNVLWLEAGAQAGPHFVDFDDSRMGPGMQDLWMLLSGSRQDMQAQLADILAGYEDFFEFEPRQLYLIEALRSLRLLHYSAWLAQRWNDPAFVAAFPWFNTERYWQDRILELREQVALMDETPLWPV